MKSCKKSVLIYILYLAIQVVQVASINKDIKCGGGVAETKAYERGDSVIVCIHLVELKKKVPFQLTVDTYQGLDLKGLYDSMKAFATYDTVIKSSGFSIIVQSFYDTIQSDALSYSKQVNASLAYVFPVYSVVIQITDGIISSMVWDNGCWNGSAPEICKSVDVSTLDSNNVASVYKESNNYITDCTTNTTDGSCDPKIYISWMGTDSQGNYMTSAGLRMSRFQSYSVGEFYQSSKSAFSGISFG